MSLQFHDQSSNATFYDPATVYTGRGVSNIGVGNVVEAGTTVSFTGTGLVPPFVSATLGGETVTLAGNESATGGDVTIPTHVNREWGSTDNAFVLTDASGATIPINVTLNAPAGWFETVYSGDAPPAASVGLHPKAESLFGITLAAGDKFASTVAVDAVGDFVVDPANDVTYQFKVWDVSADSFTAVANYQVVDGGLPTFTVDDFPTSIQANAAFNVTVSSTSAVPTLANTEIRFDDENGPLATINSINNVGGYVINATFPPGVNKQYTNTNEIPLYIQVEAEAATPGNTSFVPDFGYDFVDIGTPSLLEGSVFHNYTGDAPTTGGQVVWQTAPSPNPDGLTISVLSTGEWVIDGNPTQDFTFDAYYIGTDDVVGATGTFSFDLLDEVAPVITLLGDAVVTHPHNSVYADAGAVASDNVDGDLTSSIVQTGSVNPNAIGTYILRYNVTDSTGNLAAEVTRTVNVTDQAAPVLTLIGDAAYSIALNQPYVEFGAQAIDAVDGNLSSFVVIGGTVNTNVPGDYTITYDISDAAGNASPQLTRVVTVEEDQTAPVITLIGPASITLAQGTAYTDAGATATDSNDGDLTSDIVTTGASFNVNVVGTYVIRYNVSDSAGNAATEVTRTVIVEDQTAPVISLIGGNLITVEQGLSYTEPGFTATDNNDGDITANVVVGGDTVDTATLGTYTITYNVSDAAGNAATQRTRQIVVSAADSVGPDIVPFNRTATWQGNVIPNLVIGDTYRVSVTLNSNGSAYDASSATSVKCCVVSEDNSEKLTSTVDIIDLTNADTGSFEIILPSTVTSELSGIIERQTLGKIEMQLTLAGETYTWFGVVRLIPGYIA